MSTGEINEKQVMIRYLELSDALGYSQNTIQWIHHTINTLCERKKAESNTAQTPNVTAKELCTALIKDLNQLYDEAIEKTLRDIKLFSSKDVGQIVYGLADKKLIVIGCNESVADYENVFSVDNVKAFLTEAGIKQRRFRFYKWYRKIMWTLYIVGFIIVIASYCRIVSSRIGWIGWIIGMIGFAMQFIKRPSEKRI